VTGKLNSYHYGQDLIPVSNVSGITIESDWLVYSCEPGTVVDVNKTTARGKYVDVLLNDGKIIIRYQHLDSTNVTKGTKVTKSTVIGVAGSTGQVTGRHLHIEVFENGTRQYSVPTPWSLVPNVIGVHTVSQYGEHVNVMTVNSTGEIKDYGSYADIEQTTDYIKFKK